MPRNEHVRFLHFCGNHRLTWKGRFFHAWFSLKSAIAVHLNKLKFGKAES